MIDVPAYRAAEDEATRALGWRARAAHAPRALADGGFPTRVEGMQDLRAILDTMQEGRAKGYREETGDWSEEDEAEVENVLAQLLGMQAIHFPTGLPIVPEDTVVSSYAAWRKVRARQPRNLLEVGPGCGYVAPYTARAGVGLHVQVESCEAFYLLQAVVNLHTRGPRVWEAALAVAPHGAVGTGSVWHLPWWRAQEARVGTPYDVIMANACLCEMTDAALWEYLELFQAVRHPETLLLVQCPGSERFRKTQACLDALRDAGWRLTQSSTKPVDTWWLEGPR